MLFRVLRLSRLELGPDGWCPAYEICPQDCSPTCNNLICEPGENCVNCQRDCMATCSTLDVTGTWVGDLPIGATARTFTLQLHQRADTTVIGYLGGGTTFRTVVDGSVTGSTLHLTVELVDPMLVRTFAISGTVAGDTFSGTADDGTGPQAVTFVRRFDALHERRFLFAQRSVGGGATGLTLLSVVLDGAGERVSGGFVGMTECMLFACGGGVTSFTEDATTGEITIGIESGGTCSGTGSLTATFDATTKFYDGLFAFSGTCPGPVPFSTSGTLFGARGTRTRTDHVASALVAYGELADDLEARITFTEPYAPVSASYLHYGESRADLLADLNADVVAYDPIEVTLSRFRDVTTVDDPGTNPFLDAGFGADFHETRVGTPIVGGTAVTFRDVDTDVFHDELKFLGEESGAWVLYGNQDGAPFGLDLPFRPADLRYRAVGFWPFGVHGGGHPEGHPGIDIDLIAAADLLAARAGRITAVEDNGTFPGQKDVLLDTGSFRVQYGSVDAATRPAGTVVGAVVAPGYVIGHPGRPCCDDALCGASGCCAAAFPDAGLCALLSPDFNMTHFAVSAGIGGGDTCPYDVMTSVAQGTMVSLNVDAFYGAELTEPFLCNDPDRNGDTFPFVTRWEKQTSVSAANPTIIRFRRASVDEGHSYEWLNDVYDVVASGSVSINQSVNPHTIDFAQTFPTAMTYYGDYVIEGAADTAVLRVDIGGTMPTSRPIGLGAADRYSAFVEQ